jgi:hypothetical protein
MGRMDDAFLVVVVTVSLVAFVAAIVALATSGGAYDQIGRGGLSLGDDAPLRRETAADLAAEVRELVEARNARRIARGEPPLDVEAEVAKALRGE